MPHPFGYLGFRPDYLLSGSHFSFLWNGIQQNSAQFAIACTALSPGQEPMRFASTKAAAATQLNNNSYQLATAGGEKSESSTEKNKQ